MRRFSCSSGYGSRALWLPVAWVAAACLSIAINGSRGLPRYFVQAGPALALAAGCAAALSWQRAGRAVRIAAIVLIAIAVWRVGDFRRGWDYTTYDLAGVLGRLDRDTYLARYGRADSGDKYSALAVHQLADYLRAHSSDRDRVFVFGFSPVGLRRLRSRQRVALLLEPSRHRRFRGRASRATASVGCSTICRRPRPGSSCCSIATGIRTD